MPKPTLILTRPEAQSRALAELFADEADVVISPVMQIIAGGDVPDLARYRGMILTSANAVPFLPDLTGLRIYCVGKRTGEAATEAGGEVELIALDADDLVARLTDPGPLIHLHGEHVRGDVAERLNSAEIETDSAEIYRQEAMGLTPKAKTLIGGRGGVESGDRPRRRDRARAYRRGDARADCCRSAPMSRLVPRGGGD
ncbi:MAG: uroporphyrinogen-III synthase [Maritimibacter sp.]